MTGGLPRRLGVRKRRFGIGKVERVSSGEAPKFGAATLGFKNPILLDP